MNDFKNILIVRTDRVGDVVLTTPAIAALRAEYPTARISILVSPSTREIVEGNNNLDEILTDDRKGVHRGLSGFLQLLGELREKKFDLAIVFHTKKRTNLTCFLAGIPRRIGYANNKFGFLLTDRIKDTRPQGTKHEAQYCLDVLKVIGIDSEDKRLLLPVSKISNAWAEQFLKEQGVGGAPRLVAIHPGASCISKRWMPERFAEVADEMMAHRGWQVILVGSNDNQEIANKIQAKVKGPLINATGRTSLSQLAAVLKRCRLLISNDSGPVHMAAALGVPVISIFGRNQAGLSPLRWRPLGEKDIVLHKEVGCPVCLAHNCQISFKCLDEIKTQEVLEAVDSLSRLW